MTIVTRWKDMQQFIIPMKEMKATSVANAIISVLKKSAIANKNLNRKLITKEYYAWVQDVLNDRSREKFGFKIPNKMVVQELASWFN